MSAVQPIRALTSLRGVAAWWVVIYHFREALPRGWLDAVQPVAAQGYLAVDLFFLLSGFVISLNYGAMFSGGLAGSLAFYGHRLARVYPLHLFMMILFTSIPLAISFFSRQGLSSADFPLDYYLLSLLLVQNWGFEDAIFWNIPAWSISTEFFAYLLFPVFAWLSGRLLTTATTRFCMAGALLLALAVGAEASGGSLGSDIEHFGLVRCVLEFFAGVMLQRIVAAHPTRSRAGHHVATVGAGVCFLAYGAGAAPDYVCMPLGFACLIYALLEDRGVFATLLRWRFLEWLGLISYSTYLCHFLVKSWCKLLFVRPDVPEVVPICAYLAGTLAASWLLYAHVELPGQRLGRALVRRMGSRGHGAGAASEGAK